MRAARLKEKISAGKAVIGPFVNFIDPMAIEAIGLTGFDFAIIDHEHGRIGVKDAENLTRAAESVNLSPVIRVPECNASAIVTALDCGAEAVQVPNVATVEQATLAAKSARYFDPGGERGTSPYNRAANYSIDKPFDGRELDAEQILIVQVEGEEGLGNLDRILDIPGIDGIFLGPNDIARSLGLAGQMAHAKVVTAVEEATKKIRAKGLFVGTFCANAEQANRWIELGIQYASISMDVFMFGERCKQIVAEIKRG
jgi:4-hydroxy-2-oxoheptanedioate aldolase